MDQACRKLGVSERRACSCLGHWRSTQRYECKLPEKDRPLINDMLTFSISHPRYGYRRITILLREDGWHVNFKRIYRLWRQENLKVRRKQQKRVRLGTSENSCDRKRAEYYNHVWSYDLLSERLEKPVTCEKSQLTSAGMNPGAPGLAQILASPQRIE